MSIVGFCWNVFALVLTLDMTVRMYVQYTLHTVHKTSFWT